MRHQRYTPCPWRELFDGLKIEIIDNYFDPVWRFFSRFTTTLRYHLLVGIFFDYRRRNFTAMRERRLFYQLFFFLLFTKYCKNRVIAYNKKTNLIFNIVVYWIMCIVQRVSCTSQYRRNGNKYDEFYGVDWPSRRRGNSVGRRLAITTRSHCCTRKSSDDEKCRQYSIIYIFNAYLNLKF